jgi:MFS family permease
MVSTRESDRVTTAATNTAPVPLTKATPYAWYALGVLVLVYVFNFVDRQILSILAEDVKRDLNINDAYLGFLYGTAFGVFYALFGIPLGRLADNWHRVRLLTAGLGLWSVMTALSGFAKTPLQLTAARVGVGIGEATASPSAYSLLSDWFPKSQRATALAIYSSGLYIGGGLSLGIGALVVGKWNAAYPAGGPLGLVGWQAAFLAVGIPGVILALWVSTLREPIRGTADGIITPTADRPFADFFAELLTIIPPLTLIGAARRGAIPLAINIGFAALCAAVAYALILITKNVPQWIAIGTGIYAVFSWVSALRGRDPVTYRLIWGTPAFLQVALGYGLIAFIAYSASFWNAPYAIRTWVQPLIDAGLPLPWYGTKAAVGFFLGGSGALAGFIGVVAGGRISDALRRTRPNGRIIVMLVGLIVPVPMFIVSYTTTSLPIFYALTFITGVLASAALGPAAATTQDLVLPRMRGTATATFFVANAMVGLGLGPSLAGIVSTMSGSLSTGMLSLLCIVPISLGLLLLGYRNVGRAEATLVERARAAGEPI